ncbi:RAMP superfamily CRISPR-associated protein [Streptococcus sinensis]|uniref:RAMP superfamily CRISPR-associated protein n=1 Tax=Streptococcus sinensis TaxID=176090 RepID=UPI001F163CBF|nr:RAMP superfamily CRISPR-associated protein [Streptococcus sinensis]MCF1284140.1 RAMP superfamily CRISPR-associated protein [Streptococcus sinensis]
MGDSIYLFKGILKAETPFMIGNGDDTYSDMDLLRNHKKEPFIPGTALAGVCRAYLEKDYNFKDKVKNYFGEGKKGHESTKYRQSQVIVYDGQLEGAEKTPTRIRDSVKLENKVAVDESKFDFEIVEAGAAFSFRLEFKVDKGKRDEVENLVRALIAGFHHGEIRIGGKSNRGYGYFKLLPSLDSDTAGVKSKYFNLTQQDDLEEYIIWKWSDTEFTEKLLLGPQNDDFLKTLLQLHSFLFIRDYAHNEQYDEGTIDAVPLKNSKDEVVIPGTTWAGVFRHHMERILSQLDTNSVANIKGIFKCAINTETWPKALINYLFGYVEEGTDVKQASHIFFKESRFEKGNVSEILRTRTAIDRFTGGASKGLLFNNKLAYTQGDRSSCYLEIGLSQELKDEKKQYDFVKSLLDVCFEDLQEGYLAVGGQTAVGGGIFRKGEVKDDEVSNDKE